MKFLPVALFTASLLAIPALAQRNTKCGSVCTQTSSSGGGSAAATCDQGKLKQIAACNECQAIVDLEQPEADAVKNTQTLIDGMIATCKAQNTPVDSFDVTGLFTGLPSATAASGTTSTASAGDFVRSPSPTGAASPLRAQGFGAGVVLAVGSLLWCVA
ncbi:hypothetical protein MKEN_00963300 [Mycena kentingensis (nom. inval.)]|nr:hypothetical protein MKEN_00963300 [Mycena kentingensis (nom. inval.)]